MKRYSASILTVLFAVAGSAITAQPAAAQVMPAATDREAELQQLIEHADALIAPGSEDAEARQATKRALQAVIDAARDLPLPDGSPNPAGARAQIKLAGQHYADGENAEALDLVNAGLAGIADHLPEYLIAQAEGTALQGVLLAQGGDAAAARDRVAEGLVSFNAAFERLPPGERTRGMVVAKSNLEFSLSQIASRLGEVDEALRHQRASLTTREAGLGRDDPDTIASYYGLALALNRAGQGEAAEATARTAVELALANLDPSQPGYARALEALGIVLSRTGRPIEATDFLLRAIALKREHEGADSLFFGYAVHNLATIFLQRERYADALPLFEEAAPIFTRFQGEDSPFGLGSAAYAGQIRYAEGDGAGALVALQTVVERLANQEADSEIMLRVRPDLVRALAEGNEDRRAAELAAVHYQSVQAGGELDPLVGAQARLLAAVYAGEDADAEAEAARDVLNVIGRAGNADRGGFISAPQRAALDLAMHSAARRADAMQMLAAMTLAGASDLAHTTRNRSDRLAAETPEQAKALRNLQTLSADAAAAYGAWLAALADGTAQGEARAAYERAQDAYEAALSAARGRFGRSFGEEQPPILDIAGVQTALSPQEGWLAVMPAYSGAYLLAITRDQVVAVQAPIGRAAMIALANRLGTALRAGSDDAEAALALAAAIFTPEIRAALSEIDTLGVFTNGPLASLPFATLRLASDTGATWLGDRFALTSLATLDPRARDAGGAADGSSSLVALAAPQPFGSAGSTQAAKQAAIADYFTRGGIDTDQLSRLPQLQNAEREADAIAKLFDAERSIILTGAAASEPQVRSAQVADADILLFAVHGLVAGEVEGLAQPSLVLAAPAGKADATETDGVLTAAEIAMLDLQADWVILSSCNSAAGMTGGAAAFSGLASAFRQAGANTLLATHWPVRDDISAAIVTETLRNYRAGMTKQAALQAAQRSVRQRADLPGADAPWAWAPFVIVE